MFVCGFHFNSFWYLWLSAKGICRQKILLVSYFLELCISVAYGIFRKPSNIAGMSISVTVVLLSACNCNHFPTHSVSWLWYWMCNIWLTTKKTCVCAVYEMFGPWRLNYDKGRCFRRFHFLNLCLCNKHPLYL